MKNLKLQHLPFFTLAAGLLGMILQFVLNRSGVDEKGLLVTGHFAGIALYILSALVLAGLVLAIRGLQNISRYSRLFHPSVYAFAGCILAAAGVVISAILGRLELQDTVTLFVTVFGAVAAVCLVFIGIHRLKGKQPHYLFHAGVTVYLMFQLVALYRHWSPEPQLLLYFFPLLAAVFLMITAYQAACLDAMHGSRRWYVFCNQAAVFFCCLSLFSDYWLFYLAMGLWAGTNLCSLQAGKSRPAEHKEG